jgi:NADH dehydrogenase [ubiquinone] 1 alpha subcomplex assembly factor 7
MNLRERLIAEIAQDGPISVAEYTARCLHDPAGGYYATRPRLGAEGDYITAPHVSQMFGELIGLWAAEVWARLASPPKVRLVELGPGDGTMMADILRAGRALPGFLAAAEVWLVETSAPLRALQARAMGDKPVQWARDLDEVPTDAPLIIVANEFLDCLPALQFVRTERGWAERRVGLTAAGELAFGLAPEQAGAPPGLPDAPAGSIFEVSPELLSLGWRIGALFSHTPGCALFIDYGRTIVECGDTLQALSAHTKEGPLDHPGDADLTVHVDFPGFLAAAHQAGAKTALTTQGGFLIKLGVGARAAALSKANPARSETIDRQLQRLVGADGMGDLFKVAAIHSEGLEPPGFEGAADEHP